MPDEIQCSICGHPGPFPALGHGASLRETRCPGCASSRRSRDLMRVLLLEHGVERSALHWLHIYEMQAQGPLHQALTSLPHYRCSEYLPDTMPGLQNERGVCSEDATRLTFPDNSFDIVISQDVFEHIEDTWRAFAEANRVLRPGGKHIFTVPLHEGRSTRSRRELPPLRHGDPLRPEGALVFWDFGDDLPEHLGELGIKARLALSEKFYRPEEICSVDNSMEHSRYLECLARKGKIRFFLYNSNVFVAEKQRLKF